MIRIGKNINQKGETISTELQKLDIKERLKTDVKLSDFYKSFKKDNLGISRTIDEITYNNILKEYNKLLINDILSGKIMKLDKNLGHVGIIECRRNLLKKDKNGNEKPRLIPDWGKTRKDNIINPENGKLVVQYFEDQLYYYKIKWFKYSTLVNITLTTFEPSKDFRRMISKFLVSIPTINLQYRQNSNKDKRVFNTPLGKNEVVKHFIKLEKDSNDI